LNPHCWRGKRLHHHGGDVCCVFVLCDVVSLAVCKKGPEHDLKVRILPYYKVNRCYVLTHIGVHHSLLSANAYPSVCLLFASWLLHCPCCCAATPSHPLSMPPLPCNAPLPLVHFSSLLPLLCRLVVMFNLFALPPPCITFLCTTASFIHPWPPAFICIGWLLLCISSRCLCFLSSCPSPIHNHGLSHEHVSGAHRICCQSAVGRNWGGKGAMMVHYRVNANIGSGRQDNQGAVQHSGDGVIHDCGLGHVHRHTRFAASTQRGETGEVRGNGPLLLRERQRD
jgi:hypothetical protein